MIELTFKNRRFVHAFSLGLLLFVCSGASCIYNTPTVEFPPPMIFQSVPDAYALANQLNKSRNIQQLQNPSVRIKMRNLPALEASVLLERPSHFRLRGSVKLMGEVIDIGSNDDVFWMASKVGPNPTIMIARHNEFLSQLDRQQLPVSPLWLVEALGLVELDPSTLLGPISQRADGRIEVIAPTPQYGAGYFHAIVADPRTGVVHEVLLRDGTGRLVAMSTLSDHEYYKSVDYSLPNRVVAEFYPQNEQPIKFDMQFVPYSVNSLGIDTGANWQLPDTRGLTVSELR